MTDRFFPFESPGQRELGLIYQIRYIAGQIMDGIFVVEGKDLADKAVLPSFYHEHVRRFLWRHWVFMEVWRRSEDLYLAVGLRVAIERYIMYMDGMIESLLMTPRKEQRPNYQYRSSLFDLYLVTEYFMKRHEYDIGDAWRIDHPDIILEQQRVEELDWQQFYLDEDNADGTWSGKAFNFNVDKVGDGWQTLADATAGYFGMSNKDAKLQKNRKGRKGKRKARAPPSASKPALSKLSKTSELSPVPDTLH